LPSNYTPETYFLNPAHEDIARSRYYLKDDTGAPVEKDIFQAFKRVNDYIYQNDPEHRELAQRLCEDKKIMYAGRPLAQAGTGIKNMFNCFVLGIDDSREDISEAQRIHFHIQAHGGGTGINFSSLRPSGSWCKGANARSSGPEGFITAMGYLSSNIQQGGNRSGANMGILNDTHPGLLKFITKKSRSNWENLRKFAVITDENKFKQWQWANPYPWQTFNVSVALSDDFMKQVKRQSKKSWKLSWNEVEWPLWDFELLMQDPLVNGDVVETVVPITVCAPTEEIAFHEAMNEVPFRNSEHLSLINGPYHLSAYDWFRRICTNAWEDGCPGIFFIDRARAYHNGEYFNPLDATNPCAEQVLPPWSVCCLSSLVLPEFVTEDGDMDWDALKEAVNALVRSLNWITLLNETGVEKIDANTKRERRIGLGTIGMHEALIRLSMSGEREYIYSQDSGRAMAKKILKFIKHSAYEASIEMAKEIGPFPAYDYEQFKGSKFIQQLLKERPDLDEELKTHGIANVTILTQAPTGTTGTITGYSSGCEPYFAMAYQRNSNVGTIMDGCPSFLQYLAEKGIDFGEYHFNFKELKKHKRIPKYFEQAQDIGWEDHLAMQAVFSEQVDSSVSKTINLPSDATVEDIMGAYVGAFDMDIKSTAVYRDGSKTQILETLKNYAKNREARPQTVVTMQAPPRPDDLACDIHAVSVKGEKWKLLVGLLHGKPYEIFCFPEEQISIPSSKTTGTLERNGHGRYNLIIGEGEDAWTIKNVAHLLLSDEHRMITRLLSTGLRHGAPLNALVSQLTKCDGDVTTFSKAILRVLKKYITDQEYLEVSRCRSCGSKELVMEQGCLQCKDCGFSGCD
jgi:ribonucleoside-diphosphate reductase alpha chain